MGKLARRHFHFVQAYALLFNCPFTVCLFLLYHQPELAIAPPLL